MKTWFLTQYENLVDLSSFTSINVDKNENIASKNKYLVVSNTFDILGEFETIQDAKSYIKSIHLFISAK